MTNEIKVGDTVFYPDDLMITDELIKGKVVKIVHDAKYPEDSIAYVKRVGSKKPELVWLGNLKLYSKKEVKEVKKMVEVTEYIPVKENTL